MQTPEKRTYTRGQRLLLIAALMIGLVWDYGWRHDGDWLYGLFWGLYLVVFYVFDWQWLKGNRLCWVLAAAAAVLCLRFGWLCGPLPLLSLIAIPLLLMTHAVFATADIPVQQEGAAVLLALRGFFVKPFTAAPEAFRAIGSVFGRGGEGRIKRALLGLAIGLPLAAAVLALLASADAMMGRLVGGWFQSMPVGSFIAHALNVLIAALLFYSFLFNNCYGARAAVPVKEKRGLPQTTAAVVIVLLLIVYAVFVWVQFSYLFGGRLPADMTYSAYARRGFSELIAVACINFTAYTAINALCREGGALRVLQTLLLAATAFLLASAMQRLLLYIGAYGLTMMRILPLWLMLWLAALTVLGVVRLYRPATPMLRIAALALIIWFVALNLPDWEKIISVVNLRYF